MKHRLGSKQRAILEAMQAGAILWEDDRTPRHYLTRQDANGIETIRDWRSICGLVTHGYVEGTPDGKWCTRYALTEQGKQAMREEAS